MSKPQVSSYLTPEDVQKKKKIKNQILVHIYHRKRGPAGTAVGVCAHTHPSKSACVCLPGAILRAAVDVGAIIQQVLDDAEPSAGARLVESAVAGVVPVIDLAHTVLQTVQNHLLERADRGGERGVGAVSVSH